MCPFIVHAPGALLEPEKPGVLRPWSSQAAEGRWTTTYSRFGVSDTRRRLYDAGMARFLHTMVRITDPEKSRAFYEALGFRFERDMDIVRNGELEATNYFFGIGDSEAVLELTFNHDGRTYDLGTGYGHIAVATDDLEQSLAELKEQGIEPEREPYRVREGGSLICFVQDPDGYRIELIDRSGK
jgi:lactoylglutathione lyase